MSSLNKTSLGLNQWVPSDKPIRQDFVNDNAIIDRNLSKINSDLVGTFANPVYATGLDLFTISKSGIYTVDWDHADFKALNRPCRQGGILYAYVSTHSNIKSLFYITYLGEAFIAGYGGSDWSGWKKINVSPI